MDFEVAADTHQVGRPQILKAEQHRPALTVGQRSFLKMSKKKQKQQKDLLNSSIESYQPRGMSHWLHVGLFEKSAPQS